MKIYDITLPIYEGMPVYKNKPEKQPEFEIVSNFPTASARETRIHLDVHTGTHVDAPLHMVPDGATTESIQLEKLVRRCKVLDLTHLDEAIGRSDLESVSRGTPGSSNASEPPGLSGVQLGSQSPGICEGDFLLFKTRNSEDTAFNPAFVYLAEDGAKYLAELGIAGVGIDALGIERSQPGHPTHKALFGVGAVIMEGLQLREVPAGSYLMVAAPLRLIGLDAAPARVILIEE